MTGRIPELIELVCVGGGEWSMRVDGEEFPLAVAAVDSYGRGGPVVGPVNRQGPPTVTIAIPANRIDVTHAMSPNLGRRHTPSDQA